MYQRFGAFWFGFFGFFGFSKAFFGFPCSLPACPPPPFVIESDRLNTKEEEEDEEMEVEVEEGGGVPWVRKLCFFCFFW